MARRVTRHTAKRLKTEEAIGLNPLINHGSADILVCIAPYLNAEELVNLALTSKHFGIRTGEDQPSLMEEVVRQVIVNEQTEYEQSALPKYENESYLELYHHLLMLRKPLQFDQLLGKNLQYANGDKTKVFVRPANNSTKTAVSNNIMRAGKHYVEISNDGRPGRHQQAGIMRPILGWNEKEREARGKATNHFAPTYLKKAFSIELLATRTERWGDGDVNCCMYSYAMGHCHWSNWQQMGKSEGSSKSERWGGQESIGGLFGGGIEREPVLGLLLDLDEGTMTAYKNGRRLGVMKTGLTGEFVWVVSMESRDEIVSIRRAPIPADYDPSENTVLPAADHWFDMAWLP